MKELRSLRLIFIIYFIIKMTVDIILGTDTAVRSTVINISPSFLMAAIIFVNLLLFAVGLWLFHNLIMTKNWARIVLIVIGWIAVIDFVTSRLFVAGLQDDFSSMFADWENLLFLDFIGDLLALLFWGYALYILQFKRSVREIFAARNEQVPG